MKLFPAFFSGTLRNWWNPWPVRVWGVRLPLCSRWGIGVLYAAPEGTPAPTPKDGAK